MGKSSDERIVLLEVAVQQLQGQNNQLRQELQETRKLMEQLGMRTGYEYSQDAKAWVMTHMLTTLRDSASK